MFSIRIEDISTEEMIVMALMLLLFVYQVYFYIRYIAAPGRRMRGKSRETRDESQESDAVPGVSVIVCAHNEEENLRSYLPALMTQDYPRYEIIVVDDRSQDMTRSVIEQYHLHDPRIKVTFVPQQARVTSTKKLGLTLGIKCAQYEYLLLTDADCRPESTHWISSMMQGFKQEGAEVVLGYGAYFENKTVLNRLIEYDTIFNALHFLGRGIARRPYMGVGRNLAYKKSLFLETGGFADSINLRSGDDDLFVNKVANKRNTAVVVGRDATTWSVPEKSWKNWWDQKRRHLSVSPQYSFRSKWHLGIEAMTRGVLYLACLAAWAVSPLAGCVGLALLILRWGIQILCINPAVYRWGQKGFYWSIPVWDIVLPLLSLWLMVQRKTYNIGNW